MEAQRKISVVSVLSEGVGLGLKNAPSLLGAVILWLLTIWVPYINVGTTIAIQTIPIELSKGKVISPLFIFDGKYRQYMGEYFTLIGLMLMSLIPAFLFMIVPGIIISIGWSLAIYLMLDKGIAPGEALVRSNKATYGYKWTIFGVSFALSLIAYILISLFVKLDNSLGLLLIFLTIVAAQVISLACMGIIYRDLAKEDTTQQYE